MDSKDFSNAIAWSHRDQALYKVYLLLSAFLHYSQIIQA